MASGGKHLNKNLARAAAGSETGSPKKPRVRRHRAGLGRTQLISVILILLLSFAVVSPLRGCMLSEDGLVGREKAVAAALRDAAVPKAEAEHCSLTRIDGKPCYMIDFSADGTDYKYVVAAETGEIIARKIIKE